MRQYLYFVIILTYVTANDKILSRRKRYITFPEGAVVTEKLISEYLIGFEPEIRLSHKPSISPRINYFQRVVQTFHRKFLADLFEYIPVAGDNIFTFGLDVDMSWPLPNGTQLYQLGREEERDIKRRERRDLYIKLEDFFSTAGLNGRACVLKTLCEVTQRLGTQRGNSGVVEELLKVFFIMPAASSSPYDDENKHYDHANHLGHFDDNECVHLFPRCTISLIDLIFGPNNAPQASFPHQWQ